MELFCILVIVVVTKIDTCVKTHQTGHPEKVNSKNVNTSEHGWCYDRGDLESTVIYKQMKYLTNFQLGCSTGGGIHLIRKWTYVLTPLRVGSVGQGQRELSGFELFYFGHRCSHFLADRVLHGRVVVN